MSDGSASAFPDGLKVGIYKEAVPMGINTDTVSYTEAGNYLFLKTRKHYKTF